MRERHVHGLLARPVSTTSPSSVSSYDAELDLDRHRRDRDHGDADERLGGARERLEVDRRDEPAVDAHRLAALLDRRRVVLPGPPHAATIVVAHMSATLIKGKPLAERIRAEVAEERRSRSATSASSPCSSATTRRRRSTSASSTRRRSRPASTRATCACPRDTSEDELLAKVDGAERVRRRRRDPRPAAAAGSHRRGARDPRARRRPRTSTASTLSTPASCTSAGRRSCRRRRSA